MVDHPFVGAGGLRWAVPCWHPTHPNCLSPSAPWAFYSWAASNEREQEWAAQTGDFTKQIMPLLLGGVFIAGLLLGRPGYEGLMPLNGSAAAVGDNSLLSTVIASQYWAHLCTSPH